MATHSIILAWKIPWTEEPSGLWSKKLKEVRHDSACTSPILERMENTRKAGQNWEGASISLSPTPTKNTGTSDKSSLPLT